MKEMVSLEAARELVLSRVCPLATETAEVLNVIGRVAAHDLKSDIDIAPFAHSAMDGFAVRAEQLVSASEENPVELHVIAEEAAGDVFEGAIDADECVRIMTGAPLPDQADSIVKYEDVTVIAGEGRAGGRVAFTAPVEEGKHVRAAAEEAHAGEVIVHAGEIITAAGVGFLTSCGITEVTTYQRPRVAIIATGSELVEPQCMPAPGKIRNSNSYALAACALGANAVPTIRPIVHDSHEALLAAIMECTASYDFVITSGGAANGDYDFIKQVVDEAGELLMTTVNMRPGKAQTFGLVNNTPVFGLPGNPAAAYLGFEMIVRPALRKMQGYSHFDRPRLKAHTAHDVKKKDTRRIFERATLTKEKDGSYVVTPAANQSSGLFGPLQRCNCFMVLPEGRVAKKAGDVVECILLDVSEELEL